MKKHNDKKHAHEETGSTDSTVSAETEEFQDQLKEGNVSSDEMPIPKIKEWVCDMCEYVAAQKSSLVEHVHNNHWKDNLSEAKEEKLGGHEDINVMGSFMDVDVEGSFIDHRL